MNGPCLYLWLGRLLLLTVGVYGQPFGLPHRFELVCTVLAVVRVPTLVAKVVLVPVGHSAVVWAGVGPPSVL